MVALYNKNLLCPYTCIRTICVRILRSWILNERSIRSERNAEL